MRSKRWKVLVRGDYDAPDFEICVIREGNHHGRRSWGHFGEDKIPITTTRGPCFPMNRELWDQSIALAHLAVKTLNEELEDEKRKSEKENKGNLSLVSNSSGSRPIFEINKDPGRRDKDQAGESAHPAINIISD